MRATLIALALGAAVAAVPVPVMRVADGAAELDVRLDDGARYVYAYVNSIYGAPVEERHVRAGGTLAITAVRSTDLRAVEYFRWDGQPERVGDAYEQPAPSNTTPRLAIRVTPAYGQRLVGESWALDLADRFGDGIVTVSPGWAPLGFALLHGWRP
jgi:hypothetical protein